jgi:hypothetical protein
MGSLEVVMKLLASAKTVVAASARWLDLGPFNDGAGLAAATALADNPSHPKGHGTL